MMNLFHKFQGLPDGVRQSAITVGGNTLATSLSALALILISRMMGPTGFGEFSVGFSIILILNKMNDAGLNATIIKFVPRVIANTDEVNRIFSYTLRCKLILSAVIVLLGFILSPLLVSYLHFEHPSIIYAAFALSVASTWYEHVLSMLQSLHRFGNAVVVNAVQSGAKLVVIALFYVLGLRSSFSVFSIYMLAPLLPLLLLPWLLPKWTKIRLQANFFSEKKYILEMARHSAVGFIAAGLIENVDILLVQKYLSTYEVGLLAGVSKIAMMLLLIAYSLGNVLYPRVARYQEKKHLRKYLQKATALAALSIASFIVFLPFARFFIFWTIGPEYLAGTSILLILAAGSFLSIATIPFLALFYTLKGSWYFSVSGILQLAIIVIGNVLFVPQYGLEAAAWTKLAMRAVTFVMTVGIGMYLYHQQHGNEQGV